MISQIRNVEIALGYNEKRILNSELEGLKKARRSLYAATDIKKMNILQRKHFNFAPCKWFKTNRHI